jgi:hypothetical protein
LLQLFNNNGRLLISKYNFSHQAQALIGSYILNFWFTYI